MTGLDPKDVGLKVIIGCIRSILNLLSTNFSHFLKENNTQAYEMDNKTIGQGPGSLWINEEVSFTPPP
jgi:hypothetical protein